jgi:hypothetical protein
MESLFGLIIIILLVIILTLMIYNWSSVKKSCPYCAENCGGNCPYKPPSTCNTTPTCVQPKLTTCNKCSSSS